VEPSVIPSPIVTIGLPGLSPYQERP
jgi:hypothetical protein